MRRTQKFVPGAIDMVKVSMESTLIKQSVILCYLCEHDNLALSPWYFLALENDWRNITIIFRY